MVNKNGNGNTTGARGFASMPEEKQREIASKGGKAAHEKGTAHEFDSAEAREAGRKGGQVVSRNRQHMAEIGRRGGESSRGGRSAKNGNHENGSDVASAKNAKSRAASGGHATSENQDQVG